MIQKNALNNAGPLQIIFGLVMLIVVGNLAWHGIGLLHNASLDVPGDWTPEALVETTKWMPISSYLYSFESRWYTLGLGLILIVSQGISFICFLFSPLAGLAEDENESGIFINIGAIYFVIASLYWSWESVFAFFFRS